MTPRVITAIAGVWLFASALLWEHRSAQFHNAWLCAVLIVTTALAALDGRPLYRYAGFAVGLWLMASVMLFSPRSLATALNHLVTGIVVALLALIPGGRPFGAGRAAERRLRWSLPRARW